jgi:hypothetical protein
VVRIKALKDMPVKGCVIFIEKDLQEQKYCLSLHGNWE